MSPNLRKAQHPSGLEITFDPAEHRYLHAGEALTSVTTIIKSHFPDFDAEAVARNKAEREGTSHEELLRQWDQRREVAGTFGSRIHLFAETILLNNDPTAADALAVTDRERAYLASLKVAIARIGKYYEFIEAEKIVFSPRRKIAGTIDLLLRNRTTGEYVLGDWKTSRKIRREAFRQETGHGIFSDLPHCNHVHYSLQLHAYRELLLSEGYLANDAGVRGIIIHLFEANGRVACDFINPREVAHSVGELFRSRESI